MINRSGRVRRGAPHEIVCRTNHWKVRRFARVFSRNCSRRRRRGSIHSQWWVRSERSWPSHGTTVRGKPPVPLAAVHLGGRASRSTRSTERAFSLSSGNGEQSLRRMMRSFWQQPHSSTRWLAGGSARGGMESPEQRKPAQGESGTRWEGASGDGRSLLTSPATNRSRERGPEARECAFTVTRCEHPARAVPGERIPAAAASKPATSHRGVRRRRRTWDIMRIVSV
jgi:hypothetical protein